MDDRRVCDDPCFTKTADKIGNADSFVFLLKKRFSRDPSLNGMCIEEAGSSKIRSR